MNTVIAAVPVKPKSSHILSKFFLRLSSTLIDNVDCAILYAFNILNTNTIYRIDNDITTQNTDVFIVHDYILCVPDKMIAEHSVKYRKAVKVLIGIRPI